MSHLIILFITISVSAIFLIGNSLHVNPDRIIEMGEKSSMQNGIAIVSGAMTQYQMLYDTYPDQISDLVSNDLIYDSDIKFSKNTTLEELPTLETGERPRFCFSGTLVSKIEINSFNAFHDSETMGGLDTVDNCQDNNSVAVTPAEGISVTFRYQL